MIALRGVSKSYRSLLGGRVPAVADVTLDVAAGEVVGLAGPNGAGKTTILAMLLGFLHPTEGELAIAGMRPRAYVEQHGIAYLPELMALPKAWRVEDALRRLALLAGVAPGRAGEEAARVTAMLEIGEHARKRVKALSKGNFQRVGIAQALLRDCSVVVFDEPTHGLDPVWTMRFRGIVRALRKPDRTILVASHNLDELDRLCDRVVILDHGRIQRIVSVGGASHDGGAGAFRVRVAGDAAAACRSFTGATVVGAHEVELPSLSVEDFNTLLARALADGVQVTGVSTRTRTLEAEYTEAVGASPADVA